MLPYELAEKILRDAFDVFQWEWKELHEMEGGPSSIEQDGTGESKSVAEIVLDLYNDLFRKWELFENDNSWSAEHLRHRSVAQVIEDHQRQLEALGRDAKRVRSTSVDTLPAPHDPALKPHDRSAPMLRDRQPSHIRFRSLLKTNSKSTGLLDLPASGQVHPGTLEEGEDDAVTPERVKSKWWKSSRTSTS